MDIFVKGLPANATRKQVKAFFAKHFAEFGIEDFECDKFLDKNLANITVLDEAAAKCFLDEHGVPIGAPSYIQPKKPIYMYGTQVRCSKSCKDIEPLSIRAVAFAASERARKALRSTDSQNYKQNAELTRFDICHVQCGQWDCSGDDIVFTTQYGIVQDGTIFFGIRKAIIVLGQEDSDQHQIHLDYADCVDIVLGDHSDPVISFTLRRAPKFYEAGGNVLARVMDALTLDSGPTRQQYAEKYRVTGIDEAHGKVAGMCFVYRVLLSDFQMISKVRALLDDNIKAPPRVHKSTKAIRPRQNIVDSFTHLSHKLTDQNQLGLKPFSMIYQLDRLARNGVLSPQMVIELLPTITRIYERYGLENTLSTLRTFSRQVPFAAPGVDASQLSKSALQTLLKKLALSYKRHRYSPENLYELAKRHIHITLIHKIFITPCGVYLEGPEAERTNRVIRGYAGHTDNFARVVFQDENGEAVRYDPLASHYLIFHKRFKDVLNAGLLVAGKMFWFLGFSHSSLRAQSCWFMSPIFAEGIFKLPHHVLRNLGDFTNIRVPAKCAARIGQNFTDTNATIDLKDENVGELAAVKRGNYDFSDGVGTISSELLERVWRVYGKRRLLKPTAIQIRYKGFKGMVSLDSRLCEQRLMLRENMKKFDAPNAWNLEICGAAFKPLPMVLNRQFIKILEDLGIELKVFEDLQMAAMEELRQRTQGGINTANYLDEKDLANATGMPLLIRHLNQLCLDYRQDTFLSSVVEMIVVSNLRDIKYRGRIPVKSGVTLYGIMDETGQLKEGEIYCVTNTSSEGSGQPLIRDRVVVTRSPALHPGDVQVVRAVNVPPESPLKKLSNVVVFSQHGARDVPSQLSGGDLDGDLYNIIFDSRLLPSKTYPAADYPRVSAKALDREVIPKDMSDFFVTFMECDLLGMLSNVHMQLADQFPDGTFNPACKKLASLASTAVDFSKTGVPVDMKECPKYKRYRPDFMAPSPRVFVSGPGQLNIEEDDNDDDDDTFEELCVERRPMRYYKSEKVLGRLYRAIDEREFLATIREQRDPPVSPEDRSSIILDNLLAYLRRQMDWYGLLYEHNRKLALEIRAGYEESLLDILYSHAPSPNMPVSEPEAFAGTILGRQTGSQGRPLRELSKAMRERFEAVVEYTIMRIVKGDKHMQGGSDLDLLYEDSLDREVEALPRAMACLIVAVEEPGTKDRALGELVSFRYLAAGLCLSELVRLRLTTERSDTLPEI